MLQNFFKNLLCINEVGAGDGSGVSFTIGLRFRQLDSDSLKWFL